MQGPVLQQSYAFCFLMRWAMGYIANHSELLVCNDRLTGTKAR